MSVPAGTPAELKLVTEEEYEQNLRDMYAQSITLDRTEVSVVEGSEFKLTATVTPDKAAYQAITWTSSNASVATVDASGLVKVIAVGTAVITASTTDGTNLSASCTVTGTHTPASGITLNISTISSVVGSEHQLTATVTPDKAAYQALSWTSSNQSVASVSASGLVKIIAVGTAVITVTTTDGTNLSASCTVTGTSAVEAVFAGISEGKADVYTLGGVLVKRNATISDVKALEQGIYIIGGVKVAIAK